MYGPASTGGSRHLESSIPIILIIILAIFIAGNSGIVDFSGVPILNNVFGGKAIKVAVVGRISPELNSYLTTESYRQSGIYYQGEFRQEMVYPGSLKPFDIVILQGSVTCDRTARMAITDWVKGGGKLIVIGDACTRVTDDSTAVGWDIGIGLLGDIVPAIAYGPTHEKLPLQSGCSSGQFKIVAALDHPIFPAGQKNFAFSTVRVVEVIPKPNAQILAYIDCADTGATNTKATYAILESQGLFTGKTIYFAYDPATVGAREMFLSTLKYLKSQKG